MYKKETNISNNKVIQFTLVVFLEKCIWTYYNK